MEYQYKTMTNKISGGQTSYGHMVGILMNDSTIPRIPGDPGNAQTFPFPVIYEVLEGFPFEDLVSIKKDHVNILIEHAAALQKKGVRMIAADCGLFGPFQSDLTKYLDIPFIGSSLDVVPLLHRFLPLNQKVGIITGDTDILKPAHLKASNIDPKTIVLAGMENSSEFNKVVIKKHQNLDIKNLRQGVIDAALSLPRKNLGAIVLECTNLISFKIDIQKALNVPVFDLVTLVEFYVSGFRLKNFQSQFMG